MPSDGRSGFNGVPALTTYMGMSKRLACFSSPAGSPPRRCRARGVSPGACSTRAPAVRAGVTLLRSVSCRFG